MPLYITGSNRILLKTLNSISASIAAVEAVAFQHLMSPSLWAPGDRLRLCVAATKSGTTDTCNMKIRIGTAGTTADTQIYSATIMAASAQQFSAIADLRLESATSVQLLPSTTASLGYVGSINTALAAAVTISNVSNALYFSVTLTSSGATNTVALLDAQLELMRGLS